MKDFWYEKHWKHKETPEFVAWFSKAYGLPEDYSQERGEQHEYWVRRGFALMGWRGRIDITVDDECVAGSGCGENAVEMLGDGGSVGLTTTRNYRVQDGCHNCRYRFVRIDFDDPPEYFCTYKAPPRPPCMSIEMNELPPFSSPLAKQMMEAGKTLKGIEAKWREWGNHWSVYPYGKCDHYKEFPQLPPLAAT